MGRLVIEISALPGSAGLVMVARAARLCHAGASERSARHAALSGSFATLDLSWDHSQTTIRPSSRRPPAASLWRVFIARFARPALGGGGLFRRSRVGVARRRLAGADGAAEAHAA